ncbi:MAG: hypothetical protein GY755_01295 [Chloroflexi bacterium]|nr:hypothetical protein [Chloroflexota bacterium]
MKIKYPKEQRKRFSEIVLDLKKRSLRGLVLSLFFVGGMLFYRSGYPSLFLARIRNSPITDETIPEAPGVPDALPEALSKIRDEIDTEIALYTENGLATVFLDIPFSSKQQLDEKRREALDVGVLFSEDSDYVPASIRYNDGNMMGVDLRLKGDWTDHLKGDKWSFRIQVESGEGAVLGMRRFSLQAPETRLFVNEWAYHENLISEGVLTTRYHFVNVVVNGEFKGIYGLEESFTEDLIESQNKREGVIIRLNEDYKWSNWARFENPGPFFDTARDEIGFFLRESRDNTNIDPYRSSRIDNSEILSLEAQTAIELLDGLRDGSLRPYDVLDEELWGKYYAITDLWGAGHGAAWHNERFYYNPLTGLLEPVAYDGMALRNANHRLAEVFYPELFFQSPEIQKIYIETLYQLLSDDYRVGLEEQIGEEVRIYANLLTQEYKDDKYSFIEELWDILDIRRDVLFRNLEPDEPARGNFRLVKNGEENYLHIDLVNMMVVPVQINLVHFGSDNAKLRNNLCVSSECEEKIIVDEEKVVLLSSTQNRYDPISFDIPLSADQALGLQDEEVYVDMNLYGGTKTFRVPLYSNYAPIGIQAGVKPSVVVDEALELHPFLSYIGDGEILVEPGVWDVQGDLIIPEGYFLSILGGTKLQFSAGSILLSEDRVNIYGTEDAPVYLTAQEDTWGGVVVLNASVESNWEYAFIEKTAGISRSGWILTGGVTFYESPVHIKHVVFSNNFTEDALNIVRTNFSFEYVEFSNAPSDAFDGDFVSGKISNTSFHDIQGDAFDVSGSNVDVENSYFVRVGDKAISAGEKSILNLSNLVIRDVSIGIASKDLSHVIAASSLIDGAKVSGLAAYTKKEQYGTASIEATTVDVINTKTQMVCQLGSEISLDDAICEGIDIDIDSLYDDGILGN